MGDLSLLENNYFDIVYHPISLCFVPDIEKVYSEVYRVLKNNGIYSVSYCNPSTYPLWFEGEKNVGTELDTELQSCIYSEK